MSCAYKKRNHDNHISMIICYVIGQKNYLNMNVYADEESTVGLPGINVSVYETFLLIK